MRADLHSHSLASDGSLTPTELVARAVEKNVEMFALTDHDTVDGIEEASDAAQHLPITFIPGIEISVTWEKRTLHIVGLNINPKSKDLLQGVSQLAKQREFRSEKILHKLKKLGFDDVVDHALKDMQLSKLTRTHFARSLVECEKVDNMGDAFSRYLGHGKKAYVRGEWTSLNDACGWIKSSGGIAVIAHPHSYKMTRSWTRRMLKDFVAAGGEAIEVVCGSSTDDRVRHWSRQAKDFNLSASMGSDFHSPKNRWVELGRLKKMPYNCTPVWELWDKTAELS